MRESIPTILICLIKLISLLELKQFCLITHLELLKMDKEKMKETKSSLSMASSPYIVS